MLFIHTLWVSLLLKLALAYALPLSGDEAYFWLWGHHLHFGYYDHPPMVGWMLFLLEHVGHASWLMRLPAVFFSSLIGVLLYRLLRVVNENGAALAAALFLVWPFTIMNVLITTDTPLILFVFLSVYALAQGINSATNRHYIWSGAWLGCAFLSKYFAVLLGLAYLAWFVLTAAGRMRWRQGVLLVLVALPAVAINVWWNYTHCWDNILFNLYNRNVGAAWSWHNLGLYVLMTIYLTTPPALYVWWQARCQVGLNASLVNVQSALLAQQDVDQDMVGRNIFSTEIQQGIRQLYLMTFFVPMLFFFVLSWGKTIGLHWVLAFYPFFFLVLGLDVAERVLKRLFYFMSGFTGLHVLVLLTLLLAPVAWWQQSRLYAGYVLLMRPQAVLTQLHAYTDGRVLATNDYSSSALMSYQSGQEYLVYGPGSKHARQDDMTTDFRTLNGRNMLIFDKSPTALQQYAPYFTHVTSHIMSVNGAKFYVVTGDDFHYAAYRAGVLATIRQKYYHIPGWLPHTECYFCSKYFPLKTVY